MTRLRRAGNPWRILVHQAEPHGASGDAYNVASDNTFGGGTGEDTSVVADRKTYHQRHIELAGTELDELVVGKWIHIEQMNTGYWWMNIGGVTVHVKADRDGNAKHVTVHGPDDWSSAVAGCGYTLDWGGMDSGISMSREGLADHLTRIEANGLRPNADGVVRIDAHSMADALIPYLQHLGVSIEGKTDG